MYSAARPGIPRLYAAASLKHSIPWSCRPTFRSSIPRLYAAASLKQVETIDLRLATERIPRLYAAASLKPAGVRPDDLEHLGIPRLYAAASLKREDKRRVPLAAGPYSAALCRGLIEAGPPTTPRWPLLLRYSAALCRGLIEAIVPPSLR